MENRIVEIAQKKARHRSTKSLHAMSGAGGQKAMFAGPPGHSPPGGRFPPDIRLEKRPAGITTLAFVLAAPAPEIDAPPPKRGKAPAKRKATTRARNPATKQAPEKKVGAKAKAAKRPKGANKQGLVQDLSPPFIPAEMTTPAPTPDVATPLPRARAVAVYRKNGLFDVIGYWLRSGWSGLTTGFRLPRKAAPKPAPKARTVAQLIAENEALKREVARLRAGRA